MFFITLNPDNTLSDLIDGDRHPKPPGSVTITDEQARTIYTHRIGFAAFSYINNNVVQNQSVIDNFSLSKLRKTKSIQIITEAMRRITSVVPSITDQSQIRLIVELVKSGMLSKPTPGSSMETARQVYAYASDRLDQVKTATINQLNNYDPSTDPNWPT